MALLIDASHSPAGIMSRTDIMRTALAALLALVLLTACGEQEPTFVVRCKRNVELRLIAPSTARYGSIKDVAPDPSNPRLQNLDRHGYVEIPGLDWRVWLAYVDSNNAMGATVRNYIVCLEDDAGFHLDVAPDITILQNIIL